MGKIIVTHKSCDLDGITSIWLIKRFLPGWEDAKLAFVPAGQKVQSSKFKVQSSFEDDVVERIGENEVIHVDTGGGRFDHHDTDDKDVCAASLVFDYVCQFGMLTAESIKKEAVGKIVEVVTQVDHFQEVFYKDALAFYHEFSLVSILDGLRLEHPSDDVRYCEFGTSCLDAILHTVENRLWAEKEIKEKGVEFKTRWGKGLGIETVNDTVLKLGQKMGFAVVVRKDPKNGFVRIKGKPEEKLKVKPACRAGRSEKLKVDNTEVDLTDACHVLRKLDPYATWFLHVSKKMLLNGSSKNPQMVGTKLSLAEIIEVLEKL